MMTSVLAAGVAASLAAAAAASAAAQTLMESHQDLTPVLRSAQRGLLKAQSATASQPRSAAAERARRAEEEEEARLARRIAGVAACLVAADFRLDDFLSSVPGTSGSALPVQAIRDSGCWLTGRYFRVPPFQMRGAVAEQLLARDFATLDGPPLRAPARIFAPVDGSFLASASPYARTAQAMLALGACVAEAAPTTLHDLFRSQIGSAEEGAALEALAPAMAGCVPEGQQLRLDVRIVRPFFAEGAYRAAVLRSRRAGGGVGDR